MTTALHCPAFGAAAISDPIGTPLRCQRWGTACHWRLITRAEWQQFLGDDDYHETCPGRRPASLFGATDPASYFGPIPGYTYGAPFDATFLNDVGFVQGSPVTDAVTGETAFMVAAHAVCFPPTPCAPNAGPLTSTRLSGERVWTYVFSGLPGVVWRPSPYELEVFIVGPTQDLVNDIMTKVITAKRGP